MTVCVGEHAGALAAGRHAPAGAAAVGCHGAQGREQARCCDAAEHKRPNQLRVDASAALWDGGWVGGGGGRCLSDVSAAQAEH